MKFFICKDRSISQCSQAEQKVAIPKSRKEVSSCHETLGRVTWIKLWMLQGLSKLSKLWTFRYSHISSFFDVKEFLRQIQEKIIVCWSLLPLPSCGMVPGSAAGSRAEHEADVFHSDVGHSHCCEGSNVSWQHGDGAWASGGRMWYGHVASQPVLAFFSALHLNIWSCRVSGPRSHLYTLMQLI